MINEIDLPAAEGQRYVTSRAQLKYRVTNEGDVRKAFEEAGIDFPDGAVADFHPKKGLLWVRNTRDQLEFIEAYIDSAFYGDPELTWRDHVHHYWIVLTDGYPPVPTSPAPDPFGGGTSLSKGESDPFE